MSDGKPVQIGGTEKMSKSKNNGIDPQALIDRYGADTARLFTMFASPPEQTLEWSESGVEGAHRFLRRLWVFAAQNESWLKAIGTKGLKADGADGVRARAGVSSAATALRREIHELLKQADFDINRRQYNTVVSACMKMLNTLEDAARPAATSVASEADLQSLRMALAEGLGILLRILYPIVPHICCELWASLGFGVSRGSLINAAWPLVDESALARAEIELMLQVNGKLRGSLQVTATATEEEIGALAQASEAFQKFSEGRPVKKCIVVPGRLVNLVV
jgi:leucyl-tRNA synthetase